MLGVGLGELMGSGFRIQHVIEIGSILEIQRSLDACKTGVGDRTGNQTLVQIGVVGTVHLQVSNGTVT